MERAKAWDDHQEIRLLERRIEEKQRMDADHMKILRAMRSKAIEALTQMKPEDLAKNVRELRNWISEFIKLERLVMGEPESIEERRGKIQIQATIEEQVRVYAPIFQELIDEGIIRLDGYHDQPKHERGEDEVFTQDE